MQRGFRVVQKAVFQMAGKRQSMPRLSFADVGHGEGTESTQTPTIERRTALNEAALLEQMKQLASDPAAFAVMRKKVLKAYFDSVDSNSVSKLLALQEQIESQNAVAGTPIRATHTLMEELRDRFAALNNLSEEMLRLAGNRNVP